MVEPDEPPSDLGELERVDKDGDGNEVDAGGRAKKPKRLLPDTTDGRLMRAFAACGGRRYFKEGEKVRWKAIRQGVMASTIDQGWVDSCIAYAEQK